MGDLGMTDAVLLAVVAAFFAVAVAYCALCDRIAADDQDESR
jgi:hypothetical protein